MSVERFSSVHRYLDRIQTAPRQGSSQRNGFIHGHDGLIPTSSECHGLLPIELLSLQIMQASEHSKKPLLTLAGYSTPRHEATEILRQNDLVEVITDPSSSSSTPSSIPKNPIEELEALDVRQQEELAQRLCQMILAGELTRVTPELMRVSGGKVQLIATESEFSTDHDHAILRTLCEMRDAFDTLPIFYITALNTIALFNDRGIEDPSELVKLKQLESQLEILTDNPHASKEAAASLYSNLHPSLREMFETLVWVSKGKPLDWYDGYSKALILREPCILIDTSGFQKLPLIRQVIEIVELTQKVQVTKEKLVVLKRLLLEGKDISAMMDSLKGNKDECLSIVLNYLAKTIEAKCAKVPKIEGISGELVKRFSETVLGLQSPYSPLCLIDELTHVLQLMREELTTYAVMEKHRNFDAYTYQQFPVRPSERRLVDATRFSHTLPEGRPFRVALISYELAVEGLKYGGLGEAVYGLAVALTRMGAEVSVITPKFTGLVPHVNKKGIAVEPKDRAGNPMVPSEGEEFQHFYDKTVKVDRFFHKMAASGFHVYYLGEEQPEGGRERFAVRESGDLYLDNLHGEGPYDPREEWMGLKERMAYFSSASIGLINYLNQGPRSFDAAVINDWHGAVALQNLVPTDMGLVYAVHNHHYQGEYFNHSAEIAEKCGAAPGGMNAFFEALKLVGHVVPVSTTYALECQMYGFGAGAEGPMRVVAHEGRVSGIGNGSNPDSWNPATSKSLREWPRLRRGEGGAVEQVFKEDGTGVELLDLTYSQNTPNLLEKKQQIKEQLQMAIEYYYPEAHHQFRIDMSGDRPLFVFVGRYDSNQKGLDKFSSAYEAIREVGGSLITMGVGEDVEAIETLDALQAEAENYGNAWITRGRNDQSEAVSSERDLYNQNNFSLNMQLGRIPGKPPMGELIRAAADFVLLPSSFEPCGLVQFEAWLFGSLAIGTSTGGLADTIFTDPEQKNFNGFTFERLPDWKTPEQNELVKDAVRRAHAFWQHLEPGKKADVVAGVMVHAQKSSWSSTPDGGISLVQKWFNILAESKKSAWLRNGRVGNPPSQDSLLTPLRSTKRDGFYEGGGKLYEDFGAHVYTLSSSSNSSSSSGPSPTSSTGVRFRVLAPNALSVQVVYRDALVEKSAPMQLVPYAGGMIWEAAVPGIGEGTIYEYAITMADRQEVRKSDPFAVESELRPKYGSVVRSPGAFAWTDTAWMEARKEKKLGEFPLSAYQVELGSYMRSKKDATVSSGTADEDHTFLNYKEFAQPLIHHCQKMGYTHVELLGILEHPVDVLFNNAVSGLYSCTSRFGTLQDFQTLINTLHEHNIGVILNWSPFDFVPNDESLVRFDGQPLYENPDRINGVAPFGRKTHLFNFERSDVRNFVISGALYACENWHVDGFRLDTAGLLINLQVGDKRYRPELTDGSPLNTSGVNFLREFNLTIEREHPGVFRIAENYESLDARTRVTRETLRFDALTGPIVDITRVLEPRSIATFHHEWRRTTTHNFGPENLVNTKQLLATMMLSPGWGHILFMGIDYGREEPWTPESVLNLPELINEPHHDFVGAMVAELNSIHKQSPALWSSIGFEAYPTQEGFNIKAFHRGTERDRYLTVHNFETEPFESFPLPADVRYVEVFNTDLAAFGGGMEHNRELVAGTLKIAPLSSVLLRQTG